MVRNTEKNTEWTMKHFVQPSESSEKQKTKNKFL